MLLGFSAMTLLMMYRIWIREPQTLNPAAVSAGAVQPPRAPRWPLALARPEFTGLPSGSRHAGIGSDIFPVDWGKWGCKPSA